jgi:hypothetical protein
MARLPIRFVNDDGGQHAATIAILFLRDFPEKIKQALIIRLKPKRLDVLNKL